jgi:hypothetical protein
MMGKVNTIEAYKNTLFRGYYAKVEGLLASLTDGKAKV